MKVLNKVLASASVGVILALAGTSAAMATPVFTVDPTSINGAGAIFNASDFAYTSNATVVQTAPNQQTETGYAYLTGFSNNGVDVGAATSRVVKPADYGLGIVGSYGVYFTFTADVSGVNGFGPTAGVGNVDSFTFNMYADKNRDTTFNTPNFVSTTVSGNTGDDILLANGSLINGSAGFQTATGAPTFASVDFFTVDDALYFIGPIPFYNIVLTSTTAGSFQNVTTNCATPATCTAATLNSINGSANFIPEPLTLSLFGAGLVGAAALRRRKSKKA